MIGEVYPFEEIHYAPDVDELYFIFVSHGRKKVTKVVAFYPIQENGERYYNWGFGDLVIQSKTEDFFIDDQAQTNNGDMRKVLHTLIVTLLKFFELHPKAIVRIIGSNAQRSSVYRALITRHWLQIDHLYKVHVFTKGYIRNFETGISYEYLLISKK